MVKKVKFIMNGALLTGTTLISHTMGLGFRVYMTNTIGAEGIGLYQLIMTVYIFFVTVSTSGISLAVTRLVTDALAQKNIKKARSITVVCCILGVSISVVLGGALLLLAEFIGKNILNDTRAVLSLKILAPSLPFMTASACFRGYFYARRTVIKTASEQLIEQIAEIGIFALLIGTMAPLGISYACGAVVIGTTISEFISFFYSYILYKYDIKKQLKSAQESRYKIKNIAIKSIFAIGVPITLSASLRSGLSMIENILIPVGLRANGASYSRALADYGIITGLVFPVIAFPAVFLCSFSMLLIPELSEAKSQTRYNSIKYITEKVLKASFLFAIPTAVVLYFFADTFGMMIYGNSIVSGYICIFAPIVPLLYIDYVVDGMLKGLNEQVHYLAYNIIDAVLRVLLIYLLLPKFGIRGLIAVMFVSAIISSGLCLLRLIKVTKTTVNIREWILKPLLASMMPSLTFSVLNNIGAIQITGLTGIILAIITAFFYVTLLWAMGVFGKIKICNYLKARA